MLDFTDRVVIVTGASGNLGRAVSRAALDAGAQVVLAAHHPEALAALFPEIESAPERAVAHEANLLRPESAQALVEAALDRFGRIDAVANTVGGYRAGTPVHETPLETWDAMLELNARTALILSQAVVPAMLRQGRGAIVHTAARAGLSGPRNGAAYSASKSALIRLTESMAAELRHQGINVNCVLPGTIDTPENRAAMPKADFERWVPPEDIATLILFLCSDAARAVHGAAIPAYGRS